MENNEAVVAILKDKFKLGHLSDLEIEYLIHEVRRLTKPMRLKSPKMPEPTREAIKKEYLDGTPRSILHARYPQYGRSTIDTCITEARKENNIVERNY